jgi:hypothetical protein
MQLKASLGILGLSVLGLVGCGGKGTLSLRLTDAPPDTENMSAVMVTISKMEVHLAGGDGDGPEDKGKDGSGWHLLDRPAQSYDLLQLQNDVTAALGEMELPEGKITQIRMHLDPAAINEVRLVRGAVCALDLSNVERTGVKINHPFKAFPIEAGETTVAVVDFDVKESVSKEGDCVYRLNPVIKLKSVKHD